MRLAPLMARYVPPSLSCEVQSWMLLVGLVGMAAAPFMPLDLAVIVINEASMLALVISALAGIDAARPDADPEDLQ